MIKQQLLYLRLAVAVLLSHCFCFGVISQTGGSIADPYLKALHGSDIGGFKSIGA